MAGLAVGCTSTPQRRAPLRVQPPVAPAPITADYPLGLCLIPEMDYIPEVDTWPDCAATDYAPDAQDALRDWQLKSGWVASCAPPDIVRALSRWAKPQMVDYSRVPPLLQVQMTLVATDPKRTKLLFEGTVDSLPSHDPKVKRWLLLYLIYDRDTRRVIRATLTIRGEVEEQPTLQR